ncbi:golgin subfamily A member 5-like [Scleropages formosus]|uniref:Golgin subfamily A member 5 n=1 Tax=Scleropages formosus TaxID=113540 RepID=A0A0P7VG97_SCLFO|nr:golgin subfamily A member 5-like [Scleropages formosus]
MSWFADLAGKAEDFLNKVDQGAASALTKHQNRAAISYDTTDSSVGSYSTTHTPSPPAQQHNSQDAPGFITAAASNIKRSKATLLAGTANVSSAGTIKASSNFVRPKKAEPNDDILFDFLNSTDPASSRKRDTKKEQPKVGIGSQMAVAEGAPSTPSGAGPAPPSAPSTPPSNRGLSRTSSLSSLSASTHSVKTSEDGSSKDQSQDTPESSDSGLPGSQEPHQEDQMPVEEVPGQVMSSLRLENQLLRSEVASLNQEMAALIQRAKDAQEELNVAQARTDKWNSDQSRTDRTIRELRSQVDDLKEALSAKDGQLAVLKVRLEEADHLLLSHNKALEAAQTERSRILQDHTEGSKMHSQALETLQERLREAETALRREQDSCRQMQSEFSERSTKMEGEKQALVEAVTAAERRATEERRRAEEQQQQLKSARSATEIAKQELQDYKHKASRILQSKEKLISSLKEGSGLEVLEGGVAGSLELEELRHEKELQREEIQKLQGQIQSIRAEMQDLEVQALAEAETWREQQQELREQQLHQAQAKQEVQAELERCKQELQYMEEEHHRTKSTLQSRIKDREEEIQKLRNQITNKTLSTSSQAELESRLHQLTETLIQKQTMLEALGTEKSSLVFQLERLEEQMKRMQGGQVNGPAINMGSVDGPGVRPRNVPVLFSDQEGPAAGVYGKVRKAASTIDKFSIRLGIFLRRYPVARVFVILYMALLHLWVMIVLLTYTPEMHRAHPDGR